MKIEYPNDIEQSMISYYNTLSEKWKRIYAGIEANKLWYGWLSYIKNLFKCSITTVKKWQIEAKKVITDKIRIKWWGRKKEINKNPSLLDNFDNVIKVYTAWSPINPNINWTNLTAKEISEKLENNYWTKVSVYIVNQIINIKWLKKRKLNKGKTLKSVDWRNEQFENIAKLQEEFKEVWNPTISVDVKKKNW